MLALAWRSLSRGTGSARRAKFALAPALVVPASFALLVHLKLSNYLVAIAPLAALVLAWGGLEAWRALRQTPWLRVVMAALFAAVVVEGLTRVAVLETQARAAAPYATFIGEVRAQIPDGARVLGLHNYWLGLDDLDYRAWPVPLWQADASRWSPPLTMAEALDRIAPDVILIDSRMQAYFASAAPTDARPHEALAWMASRGFTLSAVVEDRTYGRMEIYAR
jgi:hypothetical protein